MQCTGTRVLPALSVSGDSRTCGLAYHRIDLDFGFFPSWKLFGRELEALVLDAETGWQGMCFGHPNVRVRSLTISVDTRDWYLSLLLDSRI